MQGAWDGQPEKETEYPEKLTWGGPDKLDGVSPSITLYRTVVKAHFYNLPEDYPV
jgi:hypothetical protein